MLQQEALDDIDHIRILVFQTNNEEPIIIPAGAESDISTPDPTQLDPSTCLLLNGWLSLRQNSSGRRRRGRIGIVKRAECGATM